MFPGTKVGYWRSERVWGGGLRSVGILTACSTGGKLLSRGRRPWSKRVPGVPICSLHWTEPNTSTQAQGSFSVRLFILALFSLAKSFVSRYSGQMFWSRKTTSSPAYYAKKGNFKKRTGCMWYFLSFHPSQIFYIDTISGLNYKIYSFF